MLATWTPLIRLAVIALLTLPPAALAGSSPGEPAPAGDAPVEIVPVPDRPPPVPLDVKRPGGSVVDALTGKALYHGNYCGYGSRGSTLPPVDALDAACRRHDACWDQAGYKSCACDRALEGEALTLSNDPAFSREMRARAATIGSAFQLAQCVKP